MGLIAGMLDSYLGDQWIADLAFPVTLTFLWLVYTIGFAVYMTVLLQRRFWDWSLFNVLTS